MLSLPPITVLLWLKLHHFGLTGRFFDWIRKLYAHMKYIILHDGHWSEEFSALTGVLIGDPLSPTLWNIFLSTFYLPKDPLDASLSGCVISHLEHADDIVIISHSPSGFQNHLTSLSAWCRNNFLILNPSKSNVMIFGPIPPSPHSFYINNVPLPFTDSVKYIGVTFKSTTPDYFSLHYSNILSSACVSAQAIFNIGLYVGRNRLLPPLCQTLYMAMVDCHLINGSDVAPDVSKDFVKTSSDVQKHFI